MRQGIFRMTGLGLMTWVLIAGFVLLGGCASVNTGTVKMVSEDVFLVPETNQMWRVDLSRRITGKEGIGQYLDSLNSGEYSDWRLPNRHELQTLFDAFDVHGRGDVDIRLELFYWLAGDYGESPYAGTWEPGDQ
jgi:hypothetical protein